MAKGKRKRKAPSQCGAYSDDELSNARHEEDIVLLSQPCSSVTSVPSPAGKYIPKFSSKKPKLSKGREEYVETLPKCIPSCSSQKTVGGEAFPSVPEAGPEEALTEQLAPQQAWSVGKDSKRDALQEKTLAVALTKSCTNEPDSGGSNCLTSPAVAARSKKMVNDTVSAPHALKDNVATTDTVGSENENGAIVHDPDDTVPHTEKQLVPVAGDSNTTRVNCTAMHDAKTEGSKEASNETKVTKLNQFCDLLGGDSDDEEISLQPFFSQQFGRTKEPLHELPSSQPAVLGHLFCTPGLALSQAMPVPMVGTTTMATVVDNEEEVGSTVNVADENDGCCLQQVPTLHTCGGRESTSCEPLEGSSAHDDQFVDQMETADIGPSLPLIQPIGDYAAVPCSGDGELDKDGTHDGALPEPQGDQEGLSLYQGVGEGEGKQNMGGKEGGLHAEEMAADPLLDSLMEEDCVDIDVCQLERQLQLEFPPEPLSGSTPTPKGTLKITDVDAEEMQLEVCSGDSSVSGGREGEAARFDDSGIKLLQGILTELSSLNCFVMACRRELEASKRQRRQWLRTTRRQQQQK